MAEQANSPSARVTRKVKYPWWDRKGDAGGVSLGEAALIPRRGWSMSGVVTLEMQETEDGCGCDSDNDGDSD